MTYNIYQVRDTVAKEFKTIFASKNDASAVRQLVDIAGKDPHYKDLELWRFNYAYDFETGEPVQVDRAVIALPDVSQAPKMPMSESQSARMEIK